MPNIIARKVYKLHPFFAVPEFFFEISEKAEDFGRGMVAETIISGIGYNISIF
jgi:hypothetical protein